MDHPRPPVQGGETAPARTAFLPVLPCERCGDAIFAPPPRICPPCVRRTELRRRQAWQASRRGREIWL